MFDSDSPWEFCIAGPLRKLHLRMNKAEFPSPVAMLSLQRTSLAVEDRPSLSTEAQGRASHTGSEAAVGL